MNATQAFFQWWYTGLGIGGWVIFFIFDVAVIVWLIYDSQRRNIKATGWLLGAIVPTLLLIPSMIFAFSPATRVDLQQLSEVFFYLGLIGGIVPLVVAAGYFITYQGVKDGSPAPPVQPQSSSLGPTQVTAPPPGPSVAASSGPPRAAVMPDRVKVSAWLVNAQTNRSDQLYQGDTKMGRGSSNDIVFNDKSVSREHALIREENGHFTIYDRASKTGTYVNSRRADAPVLLAHDDVIEIGDTRLRFITSRQ